MDSANVIVAPANEIDLTFSLGVFAAEAKGVTASKRTRMWGIMGDLLT
jgi:hypothetical protein